MTTRDHVHVDSLGTYSVGSAHASNHTISEMHEQNTNKTKRQEHIKHKLLEIRCCPFNEAFGE
jgi:hypothetical protein